jgi:hypothetical protein
MMSVKMTVLCQQVFAEMVTWTQAKNATMATRQGVMAVRRIAVFKAEEMELVVTVP